MLLINNVHLKDWKSVTYKNIYGFFPLYIFIMTITVRIFNIIVRSNTKSGQWNC